MYHISVGIGTTGRIRCGEGESIHTHIARAYACEISVTEVHYVQLN
jgi:hypothetical protein